MLNSVAKKLWSLKGAKSLKETVYQLIDKKKEKWVSLSFPRPKFFIAITLNKTQSHFEIYLVQ